LLRAPGMSRPFSIPTEPTPLSGMLDEPPALLRLASHVARSSQGTGSLGGSNFLRLIENNKQPSCTVLVLETDDSFVGPLLQDTIASTTRREPIRAATSDQAATSTAGTGSKATPGKALVGADAFSDFKMP
jgi:hypothetical protein